MNPTNAFIASSTAIGLTFLLMMAGCSKQQETQSPSGGATPTASNAAVAPAQAQPAQSSPEQWKQQVQTYSEAGNYDKAAQYLLSIQNQQLGQMNQQQANAYWRQMRNFQSDLANRVAAGDPSAKAAAERLRAAARH